MYGTLSFGKGNKGSSAEFHAVSPVHSRRQRQPACDACRTARVKCPASTDGRGCGRCRGWNRPCTYTYNPTRRHMQQSRHSSDASSDTAHAGSPAAPAADSTSTKGARNVANTRDSPLVAKSASSPQQDLPPLLPRPADGQQWWESNPDCPFEPFDFMVESVADEGTLSKGPLDVAEPAAASSSSSPSHQDLDGDGSSSRPADPAPAAAHHSLPDNYDFSALCHQFTPPQSPLSKLFLTSMPTPTPTAPPPDAQHKVDSTRASRTPARTGFSDLIDVMQFAKGPTTTTPAPAPSSSDPCTCLQDLTAGLFGLRGRRAGSTRVDEFLVLFRRAMRGWEAAAACPSACCGCRSVALLLLMGVQELVALLVEVASGGGGAAPRGPAISLGAFTVDDEADRGIIAHIVLAARVRELHSFAARMGSRMRLAGLDDLCAEFDNQTKTLRGAFAM